MAKARKVVLVTATHHPLHQEWKKIAERVASELGVEIEIREDDYIYVNEYGDKDEYGMAWLPQLFVELDDGRVVLLLSKIPLTPAHKPDIDAAVKEALNRVKTVVS